MHPKNLFTLVPIHFVAALLVILLISSCSIPGNTQPPDDPTADLPSPTLTALLPSATAVAATLTPRPTETQTPINPPRPTETPSPTILPRVTSTSIPTLVPLPEMLPNASDFQWSTAYSLPGDEIVTKIHSTKDGGFILMGNSASNYLYGTWLLKLRADGLIEWQKSFQEVAALDVLETSTGDFILAGDIHWIKFDSQGNLLWQYTFGLPSYHSGPVLNMVEENNGNIIVEAVGSHTVFSPNAELLSFTAYAMNWDAQTYPDNVSNRSGESLWAGGFLSYQYWVGKTNVNNGWLKIFSFPDNPTEATFFTQPTKDGGAIVGNPIYSYLGDGGFDLLISRFSGEGSTHWQKVYRAAFMLDGFHAFETQSGDFIVAGTLTHVPNTAARSDVWILRLDGNGNVRWMKLYGTEGWDAVAVIQELSNGDLIFGGQTNGAGTGDQDMWVIKTNAQGEIPNCNLALGISELIENSAPAVVSPETTTIALEGVTLIEWAPQELLIFEDVQQLFDANAQMLPICSPSP